MEPRQQRDEVHAGGRTVDVALTREGGYACVEVRDTGRGIEPAFLPNVFDMFSQAEDSHRRHSGGLGIGLALVKQLTEMHGGHVRRSPRGVAGARGSASGCLPAALPRKPKPAASRAMPACSKACGCCSSTTRWKACMRSRACWKWKARRCRRRSAGAAALAVVAHQEFDLILSDIGMPEMDGYELIAALRKLPRHRARFLRIALTGFGRPQDVTRAIRAGYDAHLGKPVSLPALIDRISRVTTGNR